MKMDCQKRGTSYYAEDRGTPILKGSCKQKLGGY
jgi:hypothetical protein